MDVYGYGDNLMNPYTACQQGTARAVGGSVMLWRLHKLGGNQFKSGRTSVERYQCSGRHHTARNAAAVEQMENLRMKYSCLNVRETAGQVEVSTGFANASLSDCEQNGCENFFQAFVGGTKRAPSCAGPTYHYQLRT
ncbi:hypothetical protein TNCV_294441 [Trichonephila clavipes]|nr:hypothetical protein TNCV_294441 [Trichonephila clavipes]